MKFILSLLVFVSFNSFAAQVLSAKLDANKENVLVDVQYGGGCKKHTFALEMRACMESYPVRCTADVRETIQDGFDPCEALVTTTVVFNLKKYGLTTSYYKGGSLNLVGDRNARGQESSAVVTLP